MAKIVIKRTPEEKAAAKKRFGALVGDKVERSMYLEGQAVPPGNKTPLVTRLRTRPSQSR